MAKLYLIPTALSLGRMDHIPPAVSELIHQIDLFVVERLRSARRYLKNLDRDYPIDDVTFIEIDKHDPSSSYRQIRELLGKSKNAALLSEAGCPCIADPGAAIVNIARAVGMQICPLTGPSSIMLGLMSSGMNGQQFCFHGYLPIRESELIQKLRSISKDAEKNNATQIFIETPYRNNKLLQKILKSVSKDLSLSVAMDLTGPAEKVDTRPLPEWKGAILEKTPAIFCLGKPVQMY